MSAQLDLDAIKARAAGFAENPLMRDARVLQLAEVDVPALLAEVERLRADAAVALRDSGWVDPEEAARLREQLAETQHQRNRAEDTADDRGAALDRIEAERDALLPVVEAARPVAEAIRLNLHALFGTAVAVGERFVAAVDALNQKAPETALRAVQAPGSLT